ncbi:TlpA family protein disulfide reductase [Massilimaliae timonensis]|uniref:TlpA family protein disulfide reductase n=1 Tax=Massiliimalia timonensis TaxID=1987501 RepID=A0A8J6TS48_9FIRM|nr:TlpA disulfide reductase family protein [Massiliimalia timonensis]MBC8611996.1 TlpA family protein disulfide reductase [Massiliimalia timonensis]
MKNKKILPIIILAFILLLGGAYLLYTKFSEGFQLEQLGTQQTDSSSEASGQEKQLAPDFTVYDKDGREVQLSDYFGKPIVLNFWASWCGPCQSEMPEFDEKYRELAGNVEFLMVNMTDGSRETLEIASSYVNKEGFSFPVLYDQSIDAATTYSVYSLPTTYFIDKDGYLTAQASGAIDGETLQKGIDMIYVP